MGWKQWVNRDSAGRKHFASLLGAVAIALVGATMATTASAQIAGTKHNLGSTGTGTNVFSGTTEICVFCHTPHGADASAAVPLWNRTLPAASTFTTYDALGTSSLDGKTAPVGSVSVACLSCHDGVTAMNSLLNVPGSGATNAAWTAGTWTAGTGKITGIANVGAGLTSGDLRNDHPIGIQYGGGGLTTKAPTGTLKDADFKAAATGSANAQTVWWVDTGSTGIGTRQKTDMVLYTRGTTGNPGYLGQTDPEPFVECASCHDPHSTNTTFLRIENTTSAVCLACHIK